MAVLIVLKPGSGPVTYPLDNPTTSIGRRPTNDIVLEDPSVSRAHAQVARREDGSFEVCDLGGKWPVRVNGRLASRHALQDGDRIEIGQTALVFRLQAPRPGPRVEFPAPVPGQEPFEVAALDARKTLLSPPEPSGPGDLAQLRKDRQRLMLLYNFSREVHSHLEDTAGVLETIMDMAMETLDAERGFIALRNETTGELEPEAARDQSAGRDAAGLQVSRTIVHKVVRDGLAVLTENALQAGQFGEAKSVQEFEIRSAICVPLLFREAILGVIYLDNRTSVGSFGQDDLVFLSALGQLAGIALGNAALHRQVVQENLRLAEALKPRLHLIGTSPAMERAYTTIKKAAPSLVTVLILGETGTGKELAARAVHDLSPRRDNPFIAVNCAAIPKELIESELFGYEKGAFTGATAAADGKFRAADGGTIFLDEVADMSLDTQAKVLRVLEQREFQRIGGSQTFAVDVRVIAATNQDLRRAVEDGRFREDLYYRLNVVPIVLPPLRERRDDILPLAEHFIAGRARSISAKAAALLQSYGWPGNIRELRNCIDRAVVLGNGEVIQPEDLPPDIRSQRGQVAAPPGSLAHFERDLIIRTLQRLKWHKSEAARILGISRQTLDNKIKRYKIKE